MTEKKIRFYGMNTDITSLAYFFIILSFYSTVFLENWGPLLDPSWSASSNFPYAKLSKIASYWSKFQVSADIMISAGHWLCLEILFLDM